MPGGSVSLFGNPPESALIALVETCPEAMALWNCQGALVYSNAAMRARLGGILQDGRPGTSVLGLWQDGLVREALPKVLSQGGVWDGEMVLPGKGDGESRSYWHRVWKVRGANSGVDYLASREIEPPAPRRQVDALAVYSASMNALGEMAGGVSHEINNPLTIIMAKVALISLQLREGNPPIEPIIEELEKIETTCERIANIIQALRAFSRNGENDAFLRVPLADVLEDALNLICERIRNHKIDFNVEVDRSIQLRCRSVQIGQMVFNLLQNSHDAVLRHANAWIHLQASKVGGKVLISVTDSGAGIPAGILDKIMQPFFTTKEVGRGTGLGLSVSQGIAEEHGGRVYVDRNCSHTRFVVELPEDGPSGR